MLNEKLMVFWLGLFAMQLVAVVLADSKEQYVIDLLTMGS